MTAINYGEEETFHWRLWTEGETFFMIWRGVHGLGHISAYL